MRLSQFPLLVAVASALSFGLSGANARAFQEDEHSPLPATPRIVEPIDENRLATLPGNTRPEARADFDRGPVAPILVMGDLVLVLRRGPERQAAFDAYLASQQDPSSPNYHQWLAPDEIGQNFGPAQADIDTLRQWLRHHGFTVSYVSPDRMAIRFDGIASQVERAFHTEIHNLQVRGQSHIANMNDPSIPEALTPLIVGVKALHNFFPRPLHKLGGVVRRNSKLGGWERIASAPAPPMKPVAPAFGAMQVRPLFGTGGTTGDEANIEDIAPYDFATIYNVLPAWTEATPIIGTGQTIAIAGTSNINPADVTTFRAAFGLPAYTAANAPKVIITNTDPGDCTPLADSCESDLIENSLDVEWSGAIAPGAQIALVTSSVTSVTADALFASEQYIVDNVTAKIMNVSYGECELALGTAGNAAYNTLWSTAQMEGIAVFVASGDSGSASCDDGGDSGGVPYGANFGLSVSGFASTPYDTAVGGTDFAWSWPGYTQSTYWSTGNNATTQASALGYIPEFPWNSTCSNPLLDAVINAAYKSSLTAGQICDEIGTGQITSESGSLLFLVDTVGGGGGPSNCINGNGSTVASCSQGYAKPDFQTGVAGIPSANARYIPDLSFFAANGFSGSAYVICVSAAGACAYDEANEPIGEEVGGTSVASPIMAAVAALINQKVGLPQGNLNTQLYKVAASETYAGCSSESIPLTGSSCVFNDIDTGTNAMPCDVGSPNCTTGSETEFSVLTGYGATAGYDPASGLGSINVANLVNTFTPSTSSTATASPTLLLFGSTAIGTSDSTTQAVSLTNAGNNALTITGISVSGANASSYSQTNTCGTGLAIAASCTITVTFAPTAAGALPAILAIADDASVSPQTFRLNGSGFVPSPVATLSATTLTFGSTQVGTTDPTTQAVALSNTGTGALNISGISIIGSNPSSFTQTNNCSTSLAAGATCTITVTFTPTVAGALTASVNITDNATGSPQTVLLNGTGFVPGPIASLSPSSLTFANTVVGASSGTQAITLTNTGASDLSITGISITGTNASSFSETNNCPSLPSTLAATAFCTVTVTFTPTAAGSLTSSVSVADNATGSPQTVSLTGTGTSPIPPTIALTAPALTVTPGTAGSETVTVTPSGGYTGTVKLTCSVAAISGGIDTPTCSGAAVTVSSSAAATGTLTINTTAPSSAVKLGKLENRVNRGLWTGAGVVALAGLLFCGIPARRRNWRSLLLVLLFVGTMCALSGCGGGSGGGGGGGGGSAGTTPGFYTVTVTGTDSVTSSITATQTFTLTVN